MKPTQLSATLRRMASKIQNSRNPNKSAVISDLKTILASLEHTASSIKLDKWYWDPEYNQLTLELSGTFNGQPIAPEGENALVFSIEDPMGKPSEPMFDSGIPDCLSYNGKFNPNSGCWGAISIVLDNDLAKISDQIENGFTSGG